MPFNHQLPLAKENFGPPTLNAVVSNNQTRLCNDATQCARQIFIGIFFDGTDNNMKRDKPLGTHTNVVRLYDAPQFAGVKRK